MKQTTESSFNLITQLVELWNNEVTLLLNEHILTQNEFTMLSNQADSMPRNNEQLNNYLTILKYKHII